MASTRIKTTIGRLGISLLLALAIMTAAAWNPAAAEAASAPITTCKADAGSINVDSGSTDTNLIVKIERWNGADWVDHAVSQAWSYRSQVFHVGTGHYRTVVWTHNLLTGAVKGYNAWNVRYFQGQTNGQWIPTYRNYCSV